MQLVRERPAGRVGASPDQEKSTDELLPADRERTIPDLQLEKSRTLAGRDCGAAGKASIDNQSRAAAEYGAARLSPWSSP